MGMTAPALYRYFDDRDDLLTALIRDAYNDLAEAGQRDRLPDRPDDWGRLSRRDCGPTAPGHWTQPERFTLIFGLPIPGFVVDEQAGTTEAAAWRDGCADGHRRGRLRGRAARAAPC